MSFLEASTTLLAGAWGLLQNTMIPGFNSLTFSQLFVSILLVKIGLAVLRILFGNGAPEINTSMSKSETIVNPKNKGERIRITRSKKV